MVAPLVYWLDARGDVDSDRIAITGLSRGGNLVARAAAFEHRLEAVARLPARSARPPHAHAKMTGATGAQLHCSPMAPQQHCDVAFDWLADVLQRWCFSPTAVRT
ncbi:alpha/beta hydrolase family protein [Streptomyces katrae]|uniref:alpha/beta hydrolase family protein n=1 Tax=Streptomyces katrae TaxID=68223 RepID=UPI0004BF19C7|nr:hypothetical protein [Streptomyces katrae]